MGLWFRSRVCLAFALAGIGAGCATNQRRVESAASSRPAPTLCAHEVPAAECVRCSSERIALYQASGDWCDEHGLPESHCRQCHPELTFVALPELPPGADVIHLSRMGEDVPDLTAHLVTGKFTVFDFFAHWCVPCKDVEVFLHEQLSRRTDIALRKLNVMSWESPLARRYLANVDSIPFVVVFGPDGKKLAEVRGLDLEALARVLEDPS